ncbi:mycofactocin-coupled SDR family oxidoreductase [Nocardia sp. NPDC050799]|uniref:mycofactocin-coupled SDR family oxidoreductase n=1 Tax=Nocardia sp. NPDC050799 TaxID=3154842 RepID=UPI0033F09E4B
MAGRVEGKIALITGSGRGQGRAHAVRLAEEGASIIGFDLGPQDETVAEVEKVGGTMIAYQVDVRDFEQVAAAVEQGIGQAGGLDVVVINHGMAGHGAAWEISEDEWKRIVDVNLTGVWHVAKAVVPALIAAGKGGSIIITGSTNSVVASMNMSHYTASKHGVLGLARSLAVELGNHWIRVNTILPGAIDTPLLQEQRVSRAEAAKAAGIEPPAPPSADAPYSGPNLLPVPLLESVDIAHAVLFLASDESRYITAAELAVDAGVMKSPAIQTGRR